MRPLTLLLWCIVLGIGFACLFGILFDQVSVRNAPAYFTIGHPRRPAWTPDPFETPTLNALFWGVYATWWLGAGLGLAHGLWLMLVNRTVALRALVLRHVWLLAFMACVGALSFSGGYMLDLDPEVILAPGLIDQLESPAAARAFAISAVAHTLAYASSGVGALFLFGYALGRGKNHD